MARPMMGAALAALALLLGGGCNETQRGERGLVSFTPDDCGRIDCSFRDGLVVGGVSEVYIEGAEGVSAAALDLASDDQAVVTVEPAPAEGTARRWQLTGVGAGSARLIAVDPDGAQIDFLGVFVREADGLRAVNFTGDAEGPLDDDSAFDETWIIDADRPTSFFIEPTLDGERLMGRLTYEVVLSEGLQAGLAESATPETGFFDFTVPEGVYGAAFFLENGPAVAIKLDAR